jgi:hypothetical protein
MLMSDCNSALEAIYQKLHPPAPEGELQSAIQRIESLESTIDKVFEVVELFEKKLARSKPSDLDEAINQALLRIRPSEFAGRHRNYLIN